MPLVTVEPVMIDTWTCIAISVALPKTHLVAIRNEIGYIMCGALDIDLLNTRLHDRHIVAGRAVGVKTVEELLRAPLESVTDAARTLGIVPGMSGTDALRVMCRISSAEKS